MLSFPHRPRFHSLLALCLLPLALLACGGGEPSSPSTPAGGEASASSSADRSGTRELVLLSEPYHIEKRFDSMEGPSQNTEVVFPDAEAGEVIWLRGIENVALEEGTGEKLSDEFLCHSNLNFGRPEQFARDTSAFTATASLEPRVLTMIQGRNDIHFPAGYGFPVLAGEPLQFFSMVINKNREELPLDLRVKTTLSYLPDSEAGDIRPLFRRRLHTFVAVSEGQPGHGGHGGEHAGHGGGHAGHGAEADDSGHGGHGSHGESQGEVTRMAGGEMAMGGMASDLVGRDEAGNEFTMHWIVPPGRHEYRTPLGRQLALPFDTTAHYITAHLHPYGESLEILDLTTGESVVRLEAQVYEDGRVGIAHMDEYSDATGVAFHADHDYELVTVYNNTTEGPVDAMAIVYLFLLDKEFEKKTA